jgi:N-acetylneuraminic acid mutarotase
MVAVPSPQRPDAGSRWQGTWRWRAAELMHQAREGHTATLLDDGRVLVAGGVADPDGVLASAEIFDPWDRSWSRAACLRRGRTGHTATLLEDGTVMVSGGAAEGGSLASVEVYDPVDDRWSERPPMAAPRALHAAVRLAGGPVVCTGGADLGRVPPVRLASVEIYDPALDLWSRAATMAGGRAAHSATLLEGDAVLITGGEVYGDPPQPAEVYLAGMDRWRQTLGANAAPARHSATRLVDGSVLVAGGCSGGAVAAVRRYWPARRTFLCQAEMPGCRRSHTSTLLDDGRMLVAGGWNGRGCALDTAQVYDPCSDAWAPAGTTAPRAAHTATRLADGSVLLAGGLTRWGQRRCVLASSELLAIEATG